MARRGRGHRVLASDYPQMRGEYEAGNNTLVLADRYGMSGFVVARIIREQGGKLRKRGNPSGRRPATKKLAQDVIEIRNKKGMSDREIGELLGFTGEYIRQLRKRHAHDAPAEPASPVGDAEGQSDGPCSDRPGS